MAKVAAFFDADRTLVDGHMGVLFGKHLERREWAAARNGSAPFGPRASRAALFAFAMKVRALQVAYVLPYALRLVKRSQLVRKAYEYYRGWPLELLEQEATSFFRDALLKRVYPGARELVKRHAQMGHDTVMVTTAPYFLARPLATELGLANVIACGLEAVGGAATGRVMGPLYGRDKAFHMQLYASENDVTLAESWAYSDHDSDIFMLEAVGNPRAVHPNPKLKGIARERGWPVLDLREAVKEMTLKPRRRLRSRKPRGFRGA
jgi:HAD superfamily hydrolase (TIGR01490 family)